MNSLTPIFFCLFINKKQSGQKEKHIRESRKQSNLENQLLLISINFTPKTSHSCLKKWYTRFSRKFGKKDSHPEGLLFWLLWMVLVQLLIGWLVGEGVDILAGCHAPLSTVILLGIQFSWLTPCWSKYHPRTAYSRSMDLRKSWVKFQVCHGNWTVIAYTLS